MLDYCAACTRPSVTQTVYTRMWRGRTRVDRDAGGDAGRREGRGGVCSSENGSVRGTEPRVSVG